MADIVYILTNRAMPGLVKIGWTRGDLVSRARGLFQTGVPLPFEVFYACEVEDCRHVERQVHDAFGDHRVSKSREFFRIVPQRVKAILTLVAKREIIVGQEIFENLPETTESPEELKADIESARRRGRFKFAMINMVPGTVLEFQKDPSITCVTVDDNNRVKFRDKILTLSAAALLAGSLLGHKWIAIQGPREWTYKGRRLDDICRKNANLDSK